MVGKHVVITRRGMRNYRFARRILTYVGKTKRGGIEYEVYSDLGLKKNWSAYKKEVG